MFVAIQCISILCLVPSFSSLWPCLSANALASALLASTAPVASTTDIKYSIQTYYVQLEQQKILRPSLGFAKEHGRWSSDVILTLFYVILLSVYYVLIRRQRRPCLLAIDDGLSLAGQHDRCVESTDLQRRAGYTLGFAMHFSSLIFFLPLTFRSVPDTFLRRCLFTSSSGSSHDGDARW